jgi:hypothetical protein
MGPPGLDQRGAVMLEAKPGEVFENAVDELRAAASGIEILDAEAEQAAASASLRMAERRRIGMAEVEPARRRRGETCDLQDSLHGKGDSGDS